MKNLLILTLALFTISCCKEEEEYFNITGTYELVDENQVSEEWGDVILLNDYGYPPDENGYRGGAIRFVTTEGKEILHKYNGSIKKL